MQAFLIGHSAKGTAPVAVRARATDGALSPPNWPINGADGVPITATATSAATLIALSAAAIAADDVMIDNPGPLDVFVRAGVDPSVVATVTSMRVPAGGMQPFYKGAGNAYLAVRTVGGTQPIVAFCGDGQ